jgi:two-component system, chemotaxis family, sensor kinase Cph1
MIEDMRSYAVKAISLVRGAGVPLSPRYADKLIRMLQRLHNEEAVEVLDIAFADMSRIGGRLTCSVWAEGRVGIGASFHCALHRPQR